MKAGNMTNDEKPEISSMDLEKELLFSKFKESQMQDNEMNFNELWHTIWDGKLIIISICLIFAIASTLLALSKPNIYRASVILTSASNKGGSGGLAALAGQFGGLASMAGINLGSTGDDKTKLALEIIKSRFFLERFIVNHKLMVPLMAATSWDASANKLILDDEVYNSKSQTWVRKVKAPKEPKPTLWEAYSKFSELMSISQEKKSTVITIDIEYLSPVLAQQWLEWLIEDLNAFMRKQDLDETQASIDYLRDELKSIEILAMETVFYQLIEEQTKNMMLIRVKPEYVLKTIDPAQVPDEKSKPKRGLIVILGTILGGMLSIFIVLIRSKVKNEIELKS